MNTEKDYNLDDTEYCVTCDIEDEDIAAYQLTNELVIMLKDYNTNKNCDVIEIN